MKRERSVRSSEKLSHITAVASREITTHGFDNLAVSDIADAAGVSVGGIYRYITTKTDLLVMVCKGIYDGVREELGEIVASEGLLDEKLAAAIDAYLRACEGQRQQIAMVYREYRRLPGDAQRFFMQREQAIADVFADLLRAGAKSGVFRPADATVLAMDIVFLGHLPSFKHWALGGVVTDDELRREQVAIFMDRVRTDQ
ncbi:TetR/AcrR family transcriptional regulator [Nocardioides terrisoli]|uniref:TetR/AcrR family transcriptional regulator n=1 Tax=Nocardioides terrisoli TaxID=3388267 RepID=UPI00287B7F97|nr:TetR/AcrR family transcriptional regulator [Nocardioides marmorisolisilvae]